MKRRVAITGIGAVTPLGNTAADTWQGLAQGRSGIGPLTTFDASTFAVRIAGQVRGFDEGEGEGEGAGEVGRDGRLSRAARFGVAAARQALRDAGGDRIDVDPYERGAAIAGTVGRPPLQELIDMSQRIISSDHRELYRQAPADVALRSQNAGAAAIADSADCRGPLISLSTACAGAAHAIGEAYRHIQEGDCALMLAGGFDALTTWMDVLGFSLLGALTDRFNDTPQQASRPFDARRSGFVVGEGAVMVVLEDYDRALARGARVHGELTGYSSTLNAYRITDSPPDGGGASAAMRGALTEAELAPDAIDYVVAHGTGTPGNDVSETAAIKDVFGRHAYDVPISSPKSMTGHLTSAAAGVNLLAALGAIRHGLIPPTLNLDRPDPQLDLDYVPLHARRHRVRAALVNAFAFGGTNACLVVRAAEART